MGKPDGWAKSWGLSAHVEPAGCMTCGVRSARGPQMDYSKQITPQGYGATNPMDFSIRSYVREEPIRGPVLSVGFFGILQGSRVYKGVLQDGQWAKGRDVTMPGQWQGQSWVIPADANQRSGAQVYVIQPPDSAGDGINSIPQARWAYAVTANPRSVGQDGIIFVDAQLPENIRQQLKIEKIRSSI